MPAGWRTTRYGSCVLLAHPFTMSYRALALLLAATACLSAHSQCFVSSVVQIGTVDCSGYDVVVTFTGGGSMDTYAYSISTDDAVYNWGGTGATGFTYHVPWTSDPVVSNINITAFDNVSLCQALGAWTGSLQRPQMDLQYSLTLDCNTGLRTLRWTNANIACGSAGAHTYTLNTSTGTVASAFTQESASVWRYNTALSAGSYNFGIDATPSTYAGYNCSGTLQCWALSTTGLVPLNAPSVTSGDCGVNFYLKAFLDGAYTSGTLMSDALRAANLLPTTQPYTGLGYVYTGSPTGLTIGPSLLTVTGANAIVDWVVVELRNSATPATVLASRPALVQRDGDIISTDGDAYLNFPVTTGSYHVALRHRNHLGVMTGSPVALTVDPANTTIDFRSQSFAAYGSTPRVLKSANFCLWAGDATGNGMLKYTGTGNDRDPILIAVGSTTPNNVLANQYSRLDTNMDGSVKYTGSGNDRDIILTNVGSTTPNNTRTQQLP